MSEEQPFSTDSVIEMLDAAMFELTELHQALLKTHKKEAALRVEIAVNSILAQKLLLLSIPDIIEQL